MAQRIAAVMALVVFAVCLVAGIGAGNPFASIIIRALTGMAVTLIVGLVVGAMAQKMLDENTSARNKKNSPEVQAAESGPKDR